MHSTYIVYKNYVPKSYETKCFLSFFHRIVKFLDIRSLSANAIRTSDFIIRNLIFSSFFIKISFFLSQILLFLEYFNYRKYVT